MERNVHFYTLDEAIVRIIQFLYAHLSLPRTPVTNKMRRQTQRNADIAARYQAGESVPDLARAYGISDKRVYQILKAQT